MSARESKAYAQHAQACIGSTCGQRDPLQLAEHSGDAARIVPAVYKLNYSYTSDTTHWSLDVYINLLGDEPIAKLEYFLDSGFFK